MGLAQFSLQAPGSWLLLSLILSVLLFSLRQSISVGWRRWLNLTAWLLIPYLGLLLGGISPRLMGLSNIDWLASLGLGSAIIFVILLLLTLVRATTEAGETNTTHLDSQYQGSGGMMSPPLATQAPLTTQFNQIVQSGVEEFHWCFLRGALWELILTLPTPPNLPAYWAVWIATLFILPEMLCRQETLIQRLFHLIVLTATTVLFFYTRNFWLCWILHSAATGIANPHYAQRAAIGAKPL